MQHFHKKYIGTVSKSCFLGFKNVDSLPKRVFRASSDLHGNNIFIYDTYILVYYTIITGSRQKWKKHLRFGMTKVGVKFMFI